MRFLIVHQNFPGQYAHLARALAAVPGNEVVFLTQRADAQIPGVRKIVYRAARGVSPRQHHYLRGLEAGVLNAQAVARAALDLRQSGFVPDLMLGHNGWGEIWYLKDIFPSVPLIGYFEFFYSASGADVGFDPEVPVTLDTPLRLRTRNLGNLMGLEACDAGQCPTLWQKSRYPAVHQRKLEVLHEGIDTGKACPDPMARLVWPSARTASVRPVDLRAGEEIVTYVARNLEPYRGFPGFMRSLPEALRRRPEAQVVIVGGDEVSYGSAPPGGKTFRELMLAELGDALDLNRVHFLGRVPYPVFLRVLQVSRIHVYLTYPFVLSWSMLEAMAAGCLVLGSRTAPVEEVIRDGENGLLVDFFDSSAIADRVVEALEDPGAFADLRIAARQTILDRYDLQHCLPAQIGWLEAMAGHREFVAA